MVLDANGWVSVEAVLGAIRRRFGPFDQNQLAGLVATDEKGRYVLSQDGMRIRAAQGHSIKVDLGLQAVTPPPLLYHGTTAAALASILRGGLLKGRRHHVHLSRDVETAFTVGSRRSGQPIVLQVQSGAMSDHLFYLSSNGVWLTEHVAPQYLSLVEKGGDRPQTMQQL